MPAIWLLEPRKADTGDRLPLGDKKAFERLGETISEHLNGGGRNMDALSLKRSFQVILAWERAGCLILRLDSLKHRVIEGARLFQALHEQMGLVLIWIQAIL